MLFVREKRKGRKKILNLFIVLLFYLRFSRTIISFVYIGK